MKTATKNTKSTTSAKSTATSKTKATGTASKSTGKNASVKAKSSAAEGLRELFVDSLKDIYWAEKALVKALPKNGKKCYIRKPHHSNQRTFGCNTRTSYKT
jgi:hypothetical protein